MVTDIRGRGALMGASEKSVVWLIIVSGIIVGSSGINTAAQAILKVKNKAKLLTALAFAEVLIFPVATLAIGHKTPFITW